MHDGGMQEGRGRTGGDVNPRQGAAQHTPRAHEHAGVPAPPPCVLPRTLLPPAPPHPTRPHAHPPPHLALTFCPPLPSHPPPAAPPPSTPCTACRPGPEGGAVHQPLAVLPGADGQCAQPPRRLRALPTDQAHGGAARRAGRQLQDRHDRQHMGCARGVAQRASERGAQRLRAACRASAAARNAWGRVRCRGRVVPVLLLVSASAWRLLLARRQVPHPFCCTAHPTTCAALKPQKPPRHATAGPPPLLPPLQASRGTARRR